MPAWSCRVECPCGHHWPAVTEDEDGVFRVSGYECEACGAMEAGAVEKPRKWDSVGDAVKALSKPMAKVLRFPTAGVAPSKPVG